jgi:hypothetical protein
MKGIIEEADATLALVDRAIFVAKCLLGVLAAVIVIEIARIAYCNL